MERINILLEIRRNLDGVITRQVWNDWLYNDYWWIEGNASCDCNRGDFFNRAEGKNSDCECGDGGYSVRITNNDTNEILLD